MRLFYGFLRFFQTARRLRCGALLAAWALLAATAAQGHEFWLVPVHNPAVVGETVQVQVRVGEFFQGESLGFSAAQSVALRLDTPTGRRDLLPMLAASGPLQALSLQVRSPGTSVLSFDSQPHQIVLSAERFHAYLHDEGVDFIKTQRVAAGTAQQPGRERYRRFVKTLIRVQAPEPSAPGVAAPDLPVASAVTPAAAALGEPFSRVVGQRLELVPALDPTGMSPGQDLTVKLLFDGQGLAGALLKAWHRQRGQLVSVRTTTGADGSATLSLPYAGQWMVSAVHMAAAVGAKNIDWDSFWASLSFVIAEPAKVN